MPTEWLTKEEAAEVLRRSTRRVIDLTHEGPAYKSGSLRSRHTTIGPSGRPILEVHAGDVIAYVEEHKRIPQRKPSTALALIQAQPQPPQPAATTADPALTLAQGAAYLVSFSAEDLLDAVRAGELAVRWARGTKKKHGQMDRCRVTRSALDAWAEGVPLAAEQARAAVV